MFTHNAAGWLLPGRMVRLLTCHCIDRLKTTTAPLFGSFGFGVAETNSQPSFAFAFNVPESKSAFRKSVCVLYSQWAVLWVVQQPAKSKALAINPSAMCCFMI